MYQIEYFRVGMFLFVDKALYLYANKNDINFIDNSYENKNLN